MFSKFKEKFKNWTNKISKDKEEEIEETPEKETKEKTQEVEIPKKFNPGQQKYEPDLEELQKDIQEIEKIEENLEKQTSEKPKSISKEKPKEQKTETKEPSIDEPKETFFKKITSKVQKIKITEEEFEVYKEELEMLLLENNVALEVTEKIIKQLEQEIVGKELLKKELEEEIKEIFKNILREILVNPFDIYEKVKQKPLEEKPYVILFCGINGTGKTTTIAKVAQHLKQQGLSCVLAAADTFRAASIEQLKEHAEKINVKIISHEYNSDPASVGFDAIKYAKKNKIDCVLIDTAGRMHTSKNLLNEIEKITKVCKPDTKIFVAESTTGNDAVEQAKAFDWHIGIDGIILTKADIDEKGGTALSLGYITKKPILYLGTGQVYEAIEPFNKEKFLEKLGLGKEEG